MSTIRLLAGDEFEEYVRQSLDAYPIMMENVTPETQKTWIENIKKTQKELGPIHYYGVFRGSKMIGGARYHDFDMNIHGTIIKAGGIANIFVDLFHKKEHVAMELMEHFHSYYHAQGAPIVALYPFRPDFYRKMGYGYGRKINQYKVRPQDLPNGDKTGVDYITMVDVQKAFECYNRFAQTTHGMVLKPEAAITRLIQRNKVIGYKKDDKIEALATIKFEKVRSDNPLLQNIIVNYFIANNSEALHAMLAFFRSQLDQVERVVFETYDDDFHMLPMDPRDGDPSMYYTCWETNRQALGMMYRVLDTRRLFESLNNYNFNNESLRLKLTIKDNFLPSNQGSTLIKFKGGEAKILEHGVYDVEATLNVEYFSSLIMGAVDFRTLWTYRLALVSDETKVNSLDSLFHSREKPLTIEEF